MMRRAFHVFAAAFALPMLAAVTPSSPGEYVWTYPALTNDIRGEVCITGTPHFVRHEDLSWLHEAYCERAGLVKGLQHFCRPLTNSEVSPVIIWRNPMSGGNTGVAVNPMPWGREIRAKTVDYSAGYGWVKPAAEAATSCVGSAAEPDDFASLIFGDDSPFITNAPPQIAVAGMPLDGGLVWNTISAIQRMNRYLFYGDRHADALRAVTHTQTETWDGWFLPDPMPWPPAYAYDEGVASFASTNGIGSLYWSFENTISRYGKWFATSTLKPPDYTRYDTTVTTYENSGNVSMNKESYKPTSIAPFRYSTDILKCASTIGGGSRIASACAFLAGRIIVTQDGEEGSAAYYTEGVYKYVVDYYNETPPSTEVGWFIYPVDVTATSDTNEYEQVLFQITPPDADTMRSAICSQTGCSYVSSVDALAPSLPGMYVTPTLDGFLDGRATDEHVEYSKFDAGEYTTKRYTCSITISHVYILVTLSPRTATSGSSEQ